MNFLEGKVWASWSTGYQQTDPQAHYPPSTHPPQFARESQFLLLFVIGIVVGDQKISWELSVFFIWFCISKRLKYFKGKPAILSFN